MKWKLSASSMCIQSKKTETSRKLLNNHFSSCRNEESLHTRVFSFSSGKDLPNKTSFLASSFLSAFLYIFAYLPLVMCEAQNWEEMEPISWIFLSLMQNCTVSIPQKHKTEKSLILPCCKWKALEVSLRARIGNIFFLTDLCYSAVFNCEKVSIKEIK